MFSGWITCISFTMFAMFKSVLKVIVIVCLSHTLAGNV